MLKDRDHMRKTILAILPILFTAACDDDAAPETPRTITPGRYEVAAENLTLRSDAGSYAIGTLQKGEGFDVHEASGDGEYVWGFAYGEVNRCVWAQFQGVNQMSGKNMLNLDGPKEDHKDQCGDQRRIQPEEFSNCTKNDDPDGGTPVAVNGCTNPSYWDNWDYKAQTGLGEPRGTVTSGTQVSWRYVTSDGKGVMANLAGGEWLFILRECFDDLPNQTMTWGDKDGPCPP